MIVANLFPAYGEQYWAKYFQCKRTTKFDLDIDWTHLIQWINLCGLAPATLYRNPTALARRFEISQSAVGLHENTRK